MFLKSAVQRVFAYSEPVDMRKSFNGLRTITREVLKEDPLSGDLYVFSNRAGTIVKCLVWDRTGFVVVAKRLEQGSFRVPGGCGKKEISSQIFSLLFDGIALGKIS